MGIGAKAMPHAPHKIQNYNIKLIDKNNYNSLLDISNDGVFKILIKRNSDDQPTDMIIIKEGDDDSMYLWATQ